VLRDVVGIKGSGFHRSKYLRPSVSLFLLRKKQLKTVKWKENKN